MTNYLISYDLHAQRNYQPIWDYLGQLGAVRLLESLWVVTTTLGPGDIVAALKSKADSDDSFAAVEVPVGSGWATRDAKDPGNNWLTLRVRRY